MSFKTLMHRQIGKKGVVIIYVIEFTFATLVTIFVGEEKAKLLL